MSDKPWRASHNVGNYLAENGYRVLPVNPASKNVLGMPCYYNLDAAQEVRASRPAKELISWMCFAHRSMFRRSWTT